MNWHKVGSVYSSPGYHIRLGIRGFDVWLHHPVLTRIKREIYTLKEAKGIAERHRDEVAAAVSVAQPAAAP
jgi:hypothetical protein